MPRPTPACSRPWPWLATAGALLVTAADAPAESPAPSPATTPGPERPLTALPYTPSLDVPSMDRTADPCVDFYRYACGGWLKANPIPPDQAAWSVYGKLQQDNERFLWGLLEEAAKPRADRGPVDQKIGDYFASCMDEVAVDAAGIKPIQPALDSIAALKSIRDLPALLARQHLAGDSGDLAFNVTADQDFDDSERVITFVMAGGLGLPDRDYYFNKDKKSAEIRERYQDHVRKVLKLSGENAKVSDAQAPVIMKLETALASASLTRVQMRDPKNLHHPMTLAELGKLTPHFDWSAYFAALRVPVDSKTRLNVTEPAFFRELDKQLASRPLGEWKAYLRWQQVNSRSQYLARPFAMAHFDFYRKYLRGVAEPPPRWRRCERLVDRDLGEALGQAFVRKTFSDDTKRRTLAMVKEIERAMEEDIRGLPWMGDATKKEALAKLGATVNKIGFPDKWRDYSTLEVMRGEFAGNVERAAIFESRRVLAKIGKPLDRGEWLMTPPTVNAYYNPQMNDINFTAGVLQPPLFDPRLDDAPNYGNTGATIGHELTHGFDDSGRQFDAKGNLRDWWTAADAAEFEKRATCVVDQYAQYPIVDDIKINSKLTEGEDVADLGGTRLAYVAWKRATAAQKLAKVDGFTPDQRFFVGMAQWACSNERDENKRVSAVTNPHSPPVWRVNGVVANLPEFAAAFSCKPGQPMVRATPCRVW